MRRFRFIILLAAAACTNAEPPAVREATRSQKDSIVARLPVPAARGVSRAQDVAGASQARAAAIDSIR